MRDPAAREFTRQKIDDALKELSMIILSKESSYLLDQDTKTLIKELFGENFGKIVDNYEGNLIAKDRKLAEANEEIRNLTERHTFLLQNASRLLRVYLSCNRSLSSRVEGRSSKPSPQYFLFFIFFSYAF